MTEEPTSRRQRVVERRPARLRGALARASRGRTGQLSTLEEAQLSVGSFLRTTRESLNLTQAQVAEETRKGPWQISRAAISAIERGQNFPGLEAMLALSNVLQIDPKELIERARLTAVVPVDITGLSYDELEARASQYFWAGDFKRALSVYDAMLHKLALEQPGATESAAARLATLEVRRATALKRGGALLSAIASAERAISLAAELPEIQAEAYVVLANLQCQRGHLPLASDAAQRAIELSSQASSRTAARAWMVKGQLLYLSRRYEDARRAFLEARRMAEDSGDFQHLTHIEGDIGMCWLALGRRDEAQQHIGRAVQHARERKQVALEASWLVELGKIALAEDRPEEADRLAQAALRIAKPGQHHLTIFRAEWLRHRVAGQRRPGRPARERLALLAELYPHLDQHEGVEEIREFREISHKGAEAGRGDS